MNKIILSLTINNSYATKTLSKQEILLEQAKELKNKPLQGEYND